MIKRYRFGVGAALAVVLAAGDVLAGSLEPTNAPGPTMRTLQEIYDKQAATHQLVELMVSPQALSATTTVVNAGFYQATDLAVVETNLAAGNVKRNVTIFGVTGTVVEATGDATAGQVLSGTTFSKAGESGLTGTMANVGQQNVTPGTEVQAIAQGYHDGTGAVAGDADLVAGNIRKAVTLFGVTGAMHDAAVPKTGQTNSYAIADDGDLERGVTWPNPRFTDNSDGTVTDNLTGLIWLKNANAFGERNWATALSYCATLNSGEAGLTDGSVEGDWRLPNVRELQSLIDYGRYDPALPSGHPFTGVQSVSYWSSSTYAANTDSAWYVYLPSGSVYFVNKTITRYVWPVRAGQ